MPEAKEPVILSPEKIPQHADDTDVLVDKIIGMVKGYSPNANTDMIYVAYKLAKSAHSHQFRRSGAPYIEHPVRLHILRHSFRLMQRQFRRRFYTML